MLIKPFKARENVFLRKLNRSRHVQMRRYANETFQGTSQYVFLLITYVISRKFPFFLHLYQKILPSLLIRAWHFDLN